MKDNKEVACINREKITKKVVETIERLKKKKKPLSVSLVAKEAGITRQTLYNRLDLKVKIDEANSLIQDRLKPKKA